MKYVNKFEEKKYSKTEIEKWAKDMLKGLKYDLKIYKKQSKGKLKFDNIGDYTEAAILSNYIEWFINNYFN